MKEVWNDEEEDGCDIYIDELRGLPDNISLVKIVAKVITDQAEDVVSPKTIWPQINDSTVQFQKFNKKIELRNVKIHPTTMLHLSLATIDAHNLKESIIGFVAFPLFIDS